MVEPLNPHVRARMKTQRTAGTKPEMEVRRILHRRGFRYRVGIRPDSSVRTTGDVVFTKRKVVVFIDGCFWHACPEHFIPPKNNAEWWAEKIGRNVIRDKTSRESLREAGWAVMAFWEHEDVDEVADTIAAVVAGR